MYRGDQAGSLDKSATAAALAAKDAATGCPPLLCKMRPAADYSCQVYSNGSDTIAPGSVTIGAPPARPRHAGPPPALSSAVPTLVTQRPHRAVQQPLALPLITSITSECPLL